MGCSVFFSLVFLFSMKDSSVLLLAWIMKVRAGKRNHKTCLGILCSSNSTQVVLLFCCMRLRGGGGVNPAILCEMLGPK